MSTLEVKELSHPAGEVLKIAAGKTLDLNSQGTLVLPTIPYAKMPTGSVLQVVSSRSTADFSSTSGSFQDVGISVDITPKSATSTLYLEWAGNVNSSTLNGVGFAIREGSVSIGGGSAGDTLIFYYNNGNTASTHDNQSGMTTTSSTGVTLRTFKISGKVTHGSGTYTVSNSWGPSTLRVMEIAQ
jgi:hypothetical protein